MPSQLDPGPRARTPEPLTQGNLCHATTDDLFPMHQYLYEWLAWDADSDALRRRPLVDEVGGRDAGEPVHPDPDVIVAAHVYFTDSFGGGQLTDRLRGPSSGGRHAARTARQRGWHQLCPQLLATPTLLREPSTQRFYFHGRRRGGRLQQIRGTTAESR